MRIRSSRGVWLSDVWRCARQRSLPEAALPIRFPSAFQMRDESRQVVVELGHDLLPNPVNFSHDWIFSHHAFSSRCSGVHITAGEYPYVVTIRRIRASNCGFAICLRSQVSRYAIPRLAAAAM